jgi:hypothetical protein
MCKASSIHAARPICFIYIDKIIIRITIIIDENTSHDIPVDIISFCETLSKLCASSSKWYQGPRVLLNVSSQSSTTAQENKRCLARVTFTHYFKVRVRYVSHTRAILELTSAERGDINFSPVAVKLQIFLE